MGAYKLSDLIHEAGFPAGEVTDDLIGIIWVESGTNERAENHTQTCGANGAHAIGLTQVCQNHCGSMGLSADRSTCTEQLKTAKNNLKIAHDLWQAAGQSFARDWPTYSGGAYKAFKGKDTVIFVKEGTPLIGGVVDPIGNAVDGALGAAGDAAGAAFSAAKAVPKLIGALFDPSTYLRIGKGTLGGVFVIAGTGALVFIVANKVTNGGATKALESAAVAA